MTRLLAALCAIAPIIPLFVDPFDDYNTVVVAMSDGIVQPRLAATAAFTGVALVWIAVLALRGRASPLNLAPVLWTAVGAFVLVNVLATVFAEDWRASIIGERLRYQGLGATLLYVLLLGVAAYAIRTLDDLRTVVTGLFVGAVIAAGYALVQRAGLDWITWAGRELDRPASTVGQVNTFAAFLVLAINASALLLPAGEVRWRAALPWISALALGWTVVVLLVVAGVSTGIGAIIALAYTVALAEVAIAVAGARALADTAIISGLIAMFAALLFTISRAGYLAMFVSLIIWSIAAVVWFVYVRRNRQPSTGGVAGIVAGALVLVVVTAVALPFSARGLQNAGLDLGRYGDRIEATTDLDTSEIATRRALWSLAWDMTLDRPLVGFGHDGFSIQFPQYRDRPDLPGIGTESVDPESAHNALLDISSGTGLLGLLSFLFLIGVVLFFGAKKALSSDDLSARIALVALISASVGYLVAVTLGFTEAITTWAFWLLLGATAGLAARRAGHADVEEQPRGWITAKALPLALASIGVVALLWAATFTAANLASGQARAALDEGDASTGLRLARRAVSLDPLERAYVMRKGDAYQQSGADFGNEEASRRAAATYLTAVSRFAPESTAAVAYALSRQQLLELQGQPVDEVWPAFEIAVGLDPFNACLRRFVADNYLARGEYARALRHTVMIRHFSFEGPLPRCVQDG